MFSSDWLIALFVIAYMLALNSRIVIILVILKNCILSRAIDWVYFFCLVCVTMLNG